MKKILYILSILLLPAALVGCDDDLLDVTPGSDITDDAYWKSESHLKGACNRLYFHLDLNIDYTDLNGGSAAWYPDVRSDEIMPQTGSFNSISNGSRTVPAENESDWTEPYTKIFVANNIIEKGQNTPIDEKVRDRWLAEAHFFRAWHHFDLVRKYGDVPLVLKTFTSVYDPDLKQGRTPREEVIQQCYKDLELAAENLPTRAAWSTADEFDRRRATRSSALGLIVRIGLFEGTMQKHHDLSGEATWKAHLKKSIDAFELLKKEGHALYGNFSNLFLPAGETGNTEILFAKAYGLNGASPTTSHAYTRELEGRYALTRQMVDLFLYEDGLPRDKTAKKIPVENSYNSIVGWEADGTPRADGLGKRDPRLERTVWLINDPLENDATVGWILTGKNAYKPFDSQRPFGYPIKKAFMGSLWTSQKEYTDKIHIRWGEMLISYAEALYEYNGSITDAQLDETVNALRNRVGFTAPLSNAFATSKGLDLLTEIRRERTVELMTEGFRYYDLIRWKEAENALPKALLGAKFVDDEPALKTLRPEFAANLTDANGKIKDNGVGVQVYDEPDIYVIEKPSTRRFNSAKDYYYPIPLFEIAQSEGSVKQNPGWN